MKLSWVVIAAVTMTPAGALAQTAPESPGAEHKMGPASGPTVQTAAQNAAAQAAVLAPGAAATGNPAAPAPPKRRRQKVVWRGVLLSDERLEMLKLRIAQQQEPTYDAFLRAKMDADANMERQPSAMEVWYVPARYKDPAGHSKGKRALQDDANAAYGLALVYRLTGEEKYAAASLRLILGWANTVRTLETKDDSQLSFSYHFPAFIFAADLLRPFSSWETPQRDAFATFLREKALPMNTADRKNNWGNWGLVLVTSIAAYLRDERALRKGEARWRAFIDEQMDDEGNLTHEVTRGKPEGSQGLWYSHFSLMPQTLAAEILRVNGIDDYDYQSASGHSLKLAYQRLAPWVLKPETFPYFKGTDVKQQSLTDYVSYWEILQNWWPNSSASAVLTARRPTTANHSAPYLTLTHGGMPPQL